MDEQSPQHLPPHPLGRLRRETPSGPSGLDPFFQPRSVAVIGATPKPGAVGRMILWNLISQPFGGTVYAVNPNRPNVLGVKTHPNVGAIEEPVDLAVIVTPAPTVHGVVKECVAAGVRAAIVISAGFKETGEEGLRMEREILATARDGNLRIVGPNCLGLMNPVTGLNASFANVGALSGSVAFLSQSGALCSAILDWSLRERVGFSAFVSIGSMLDVNWGDLIHHLGDDPNTKSIIVYMETIGDARSFLSAAREVALTKPIIVLKPGKTAAGARAAASHTGSLAGSDAVLDAAFHRCGVLRVQNISSLFYMAEALAKQPRPRGPRLAILTNAGGPGVLATDALLEEGGQLAELGPESHEALDAFLPAHWSRNNPVDILGDADAGRYGRSAQIVADDPNIDGLLVVLTPQAVTQPTETAQLLAQVRMPKDKPLLASWMGGVEVAAGEAILNRSGIPAFPYPDTAARVFNYMQQYSRNLDALYETPSLPSDDPPDYDAVAALLDDHRQTGRTLLSEHASKRLLAAYGIPTTPSELAATAEEAVAAAERIGFPAVLKLHSQTLTHKTDVGGVQLNLASAEAVRNAFGAIREGAIAHGGSEAFEGVTVQPMVRREGYELIVGSSIDAQFGPVLLFGAGGQLVEVFKDSALGLPPLNTTLARQMVERTRIHKALLGVRGRPPVDMAALERFLVRFSQLVCEQPWIKEIDINPLLAGPDGLLALDARVVLHETSTGESALPRTAIRPYPREYTTRCTLPDGRELTIRPIRPEDEPLLVRFQESLSEETVYRRFFEPVPLERRLQHRYLARLCYIDYDRAMALVAIARGAEGQEELVCVARYAKDHRGPDAEFAIVVGDAWQRHGVGTRALDRLVETAKAEGVARLHGAVLGDNVGMLALCAHAGFVHAGPPGPIVTVERVLHP